MLSLIELWVGPFLGVLVVLLLMNVLSTQEDQGTSQIPKPWAELTNKACSPDSWSFQWAERLLGCRICSFDPLFELNTLGAEKGVQSSLDGSHQEQHQSNNVHCTPLWRKPHIGRHSLRVRFIWEGKGTPETHCSAHHDLTHTRIAPQTQVWDCGRKHGGRGGTPATMTPYREDETRMTPCF